MNLINIEMEQKFILLYLSHLQEVNLDKQAWILTHIYIYNYSICIFVERCGVFKGK